MGMSIIHTTKRTGKKQKSFIRKTAEAGNIFLMLFGAVGMVGVLGAATMTVMKGPVRTMSIVTKRTIAENNMIATGRLALIASAVQPDSDCDGDGTVEPIAYGAPITGLTGGGEIPATIGAATQDPWGTPYGYCTWDHGTLIDDAACGDGLGGGYEQGNATETGFVLAIVSAGPDRIFEASCNDDPATLLDRPSGADDITMGYTFADANSIAAGLWNLQSGDPDIAEISKDLEVTSAAGNLAFGVAEVNSGGTDRPAIQADYVSALTLAGDIELLSPLVSAANISGADISGANLSTSGTLNVTGTSTLGVVNAGATSATTLSSSGLASLNSLGVSGNVTLGSALTNTVGVAGDLTVAGTFIPNNLNVTNNATVGGTLGVTGVSTLGVLSAGTTTVDSLASTNNATVGGTLGVTGVSTLGILGAGATTIDSLTVTNATSIGGVLNMNTQVITGVADPGADTTAAANKAYVDAQVAAGTGFTEDDPQVGTLASNQYCVANAGASAIDCTATLPGETDPQVGVVTTSGNFCRSDGTSINCDQTPADIVTPANGNDTEVQYNDSGSFAGDSGFTYDDATDTLTVDSTINIGELLNIGATTGAAAPIGATGGGGSGSGSAIFEVTGAAGSELVSTVDATAPYATSDFIIGSNQLDDAAGTDDDARMFFDKSKGAFRAGQPFNTEWDSADVGDRSIGLGAGQASGLGAVAIGSFDNIETIQVNLTAAPIASGNQAIALGTGAVSSNTGSMALGINTQSSGRFSVAIGGASDPSPNRIASGANSLSLNGLASGARSIAVGEGTTASGVRSIAFGTEVLAGTGIGQTNTANSGVGNYSVAFGLGNSGTGNDPRVTGNESFGVFMGDQTDSNVTGENTFALVGGSMVIDPGTGITVAAPAAELSVIGDIEYTGTITDVSDRRLKNNITPLNKDGALLEKVASIDTYSFTMKDDADNRKEFGVIAQEIEKIFPELVHTAKDEAGTKSVNYVGLIGPMIEATKELKAENDTLKADIVEIKKQIYLLNKTTNEKNGNSPSSSANSVLLYLLLGVFGTLSGVLIFTRRSNKAK